MPHWPDIFDALSAEGLNAEPGTTPAPQSGGDISAAWRLQTTDGPVFLKTGPLETLSSFAAEHDALNELAAANAVRVPAGLCAVAAGNTAVLALEWLELEPTNEELNTRFGQQLAALHRVQASEFGWSRDNVIGSTPQPNDRTDDWLAFYREQRLRHQLLLAAKNGYGGRLQDDGAWLCDNLAALFADYQPQPSLLHGDLWGGNWAACNGQPVMFDPATYYGDRETDLAMTRLFGGFTPLFYRAYEKAWPLDAGYEQRVPLYQLYHVLNHLNLFGSGYESQALRLMDTLRRHIGHR